MIQATQVDRNMSFSAFGVAPDGDVDGVTRKDNPSRLKICLAASGGGHVRQILDLEPVWSAFDHFFVTEDTALGKSISSACRTYFVPHVALGQARLGRPFKMVGEAFRNLYRSARTILRERPDVVITTGAGAVFFVALFARLLGARIIMIDSFARFEKPSVFARLVSPWSSIRIVQSARMKNSFRDVHVFEPLKILDVPRPDKEKLMFVTVGATLPFDRMIEMVAAAKDDGLIPEKVIAQVGIDGVCPDGIETVETLSFAEMHGTLDRADLVVCHGGTGSLITALQHGCRVIVVPRSFERREHYDNHQMEIASAFQARGLIQVADTPAEFIQALRNVRSKTPLTATTDTTELRNFLTEVLAPAA